MCRHGPHPHRPSNHEVDALRHPSPQAHDARLYSEHMQQLVCQADQMRHPVQECQSGGYQPWYQSHRQFDVHMRQGHTHLPHADRRLDGTFPTHHHGPVVASVGERGVYNNMSDSEQRGQGVQCVPGTDIQTCGSPRPL